MGSTLKLRILVLENDILHLRIESCWKGRQNENFRVASPENMPSDVLKPPATLNIF